MRKAFVAAGLGSLSFILAGAVQAATINVPGDQPMIQEAIWAAEDGDEAVVAPGTHYEWNIRFFDKAITVRSSDPNSPAVVGATVIDGQGNGPVFNFYSHEDGDSILSGLTITNGQAGEGLSFGGGVSCHESSPTITKCIITRNSATYGGGIYLYQSSPLISDNIITDNSASQSGGGIAYSGKGSPTISHNTITGNSAVFYGGGLSCGSGSSATISDNVITDNRSAHGAGISCMSEAATTIINNIVCENVGVRDGPCGTSMGGGIYCAHASPAITNNTISHTSADWGGGIMCNLSSSPTIKNCIITFSPSGGGIYRHSGSPTVRYCDVFRNVDADDEQANYVGIDDQTGTNGNISVHPRWPGADRDDFHLRSEAGRWNPNTQRWVRDGVTSPCIDAGDPNSECNHEPPGNGRRINMGAYGNTPEASRTTAWTVVPGPPKVFKPRRPIQVQPKLIDQ